MNRSYYLDLAARGLRMPIGTDLVLHEQADPELVRRDGARLGRVVEETARHYRTPIAFPLMDLRLDKADLVSFFGIDSESADSFQFSTAPSSSEAEQLRSASARPFPEHSRALMDSIRYVRSRGGLLAVGMAIGPFSLATKLMADPITAVAMAGAGATAEEDESVRLAEACLALAEATVQRSVKAQIEAGAQAVLICEPAANRVYISPRQVSAGSGIFEQYVIRPNAALRDMITEAGADLIFHDCGELTADMVRQFATVLRPAILSLGSSRRLWEDAAVVPGDVVLYGNLPTKTFYSDALMPVERVRQMAEDLVRRMQATGHPHILGSECDVLHVPEFANTIRAKVDAAFAG